MSKFNLIFLKIFSCVLFCFLFSVSVFAADFSPTGTWLIIDDKTQNPQGIIEIWQEGDTLLGKIKKILPAAGPEDICKYCSGNLRNQPIEGLTIMWGLKKTENNTWSDGYILDPNSGHIYRCKITLSADNQKLYVRGYIGITFLGRTQTWIRQQ